MTSAATWKITGAALLIFAAGVFTGALATATATANRPARRERANVRPAQPTPDSPAARLPAAQPGPVPAGSPTRRAERPATRPAAFQRLEALRRLEEQIELSPAQKDRIQGLIRESEQRIRADWDPVMPRIQAEIRDLRRRISAELDPAQRQRFEALFERRDPQRRPAESPEGVR